MAPDLLGQYLVRGAGASRVVLRITEVEAYGGPEDSASHCRAGRTARNAPMWGPPGHAYVYLCYGIHQMLNVVTGAEGQGQAVLVRACEVVSGEALVRTRRGGSVDLAGPGKVGQALALDASFSGHPLFVPGGLELQAGEPSAEVLVGPRVGIDFASPRDRKALLRFGLAGAHALSHTRSLRPRR